MATRRQRLVNALLSGALLLGAAFAPVAAADEPERQRVGYLYPHDGPRDDGPRAVKTLASLGAVPEAARPSEEGPDRGEGPRWLWMLAGLVGIGLMANGRMR